MAELSNQPFRELGQKLKSIRERLHESLLDVSGAVEVDIAMLEEIEGGVKRPSEDMLLLLINYFSVKEEEAGSLWRMAGYDKPKDSDKEPSPNSELQNKPYMMIMPMDARVIYTDLVNVAVNNYGVVMNFMQNSGTNQPLAVARIGMSHEHAQSVLKVLQQTLDQHSKQNRTKLLSEDNNKKSSDQV